jgi:hypothetical protein
MSTSDVVAERSQGTYELGGQPPAPGGDQAP